MMRRIVITRPDFFDGEADAIERQLEIGADYVHIRKPGAPMSSVRTLVEEIDARFYPRLALHDHLSLASEYGLGGVHLNSRSGNIPDGFAGRVSRSCHSIDELTRHTDEDYLFLSPVFDSKSKRGYKSGFTLDEIEAACSTGIIDSRIIALGGVDGSHLTLLEGLGFGGAAMIGAAWNPVDKAKFRLQYITQITDPSNPAESLVAGVEQALAGGCRWVQLRMKDASDDEILDVAAKIEPLCRAAGAVFIIDDRVDLVKKCRAHGVHLGKNDMPVNEARLKLGPGFIVGATANTFQDIQRAEESGADYIGLGPMRFTTTKKNLSPVLGYGGYREIIGRCRRSGISLPVVAIGGILPSDIHPLSEAGVDGIAVSGAICKDPQPEVRTREFVNLLNQYIQ